MKFLTDLIVKPLSMALVVLGLTISVNAVGAGNATPEVTVTNIRRAFHNGEHNAFTDLCRFNGQLYLTFRSCPDGHMVYNTASVLILRSKDEGATWEQVHRFSVKDRDTRDPHFMEFKGKLFVYTGTWYSGAGVVLPKDYDMNKMLGFAVWTENGTDWNSPVLLEGTFGFYIWRAAAYNGKAYLCARRKPGFNIEAKGEGEKVQALLLESEDGLNWKKCATMAESAGDETAFLFEKDGTLIGVGRHGGGKNARLLRSRPPYQEWEHIDLGRPMGGPLIVQWGDRFIAAGRKTINKVPSTAFYWLEDDKLKEFAELPSGGDNSYPGFVELGNGRALISYYSSHEKDADGKVITAIYLAEQNLKKK